MRCTMGLLKLVIVDDEPILLEGLVKTYDWNGMGYEVVGFAQSGEQALKVIREKKPHVVLTDIRMKQISGLMVMEEIKKENPECQFVVLSAYRDFEYAKKACDLGAFAYLLKPIEDEKLQATMTDVGKICEDQIRNEEKYDRWERLLKKDGDGFLQVVVQKYVQNRLPEEKVDEVFHTLQDVMKEGDRFITVYADLDLAYKITNELEYEASRFSMVRMIEEKIAERFTYWKFESEEGHRTFIIKTQENTAVHELKELLEQEDKPIYVAAGEDDVCIGYAFCQLKEQPFSTNMVPFKALFIDDLCVDKQTRGQHIGESLFEYVKQQAKKLGCYEVTLNVWAGNTSAESFYEKMGMKTKERQMEYIL